MLMEKEYNIKIKEGHALKSIGCRFLYVSMTCLSKTKYQYMGRFFTS